jgi:uncharacterized paraquat-inducible protein A
MKSNNQPRNYYICKGCETANVFQPWALGKERLAKCPHCRHLNKLPFTRNPKQVWLALLSVAVLLVLSSLFWTWFSKAYSNGMY